MHTPRSIFPITFSLSIVLVAALVALVGRPRPPALDAVGQFYRAVCAGLGPGEFCAVEVPECVKRTGLGGAVAQGSDFLYLARTRAGFGGFAFGRQKTDRPGSAGFALGYELGCAPAGGCSSVLSVGAGDRPQGAAAPRLADTPFDSDFFSCRSGSDSLRSFSRLLKVAGEEVLCGGQVKRTMFSWSRKGASETETDFNGRLSVIRGPMAACRCSESELELDAFLSSDAKPELEARARWAGAPERFCSTPEPIYVRIYPKDAALAVSQSFLSGTKRSVSCAESYVVEAVTGKVSKRLALQVLCPAKGEPVLAPAMS